MSKSLRFDLMAPSSDLHEYARPNDTIVLHEVRDGVPSGRVVLAQIVAAGDLGPVQAESAQRGSGRIARESYDPADDAGAKQRRDAHEHFADRNAGVSVEIQYGDYSEAASQSGSRGRTRA